MGGSLSDMYSKGSRLLIIVHPGGVKEVYNRPVCAAAVMSRNPRHYITSPDVFERPWMVVRPDALLMPGRRFYLVPKGTIRRLLKQHGILTASSNSINANCSQSSVVPENDNMLTMPDLPAEAFQGSAEEPDLKVGGSNPSASPKKVREKPDGARKLRDLLKEPQVPRVSDAAKLGFRFVEPPAVNVEARASNSVDGAPSALLYCHLVSHPRAWVSKSGGRKCPARQCKVRFKSPCVQAVYYISPYSSSDGDLTPASGSSPAVKALEL